MRASISTEMSADNWYFPAIHKEQPEVVGISIGTQMQLLAGMTFCKMIKTEFPDIHVTVGGNVITRLQEDLPKQDKFFTNVFDTAILYEGEHALGLAIGSAGWGTCLGAGSQPHVASRWPGKGQYRNLYGKNNGVAPSGF